MTNHSISLEYVERRLHQWAAWFDSGNAYQLGHSSCSLEYRLMKEGIIVKSKGCKPLPSHDEAEEVEAWVCELAQYAPDIAFALRRHYFSPYAFNGKRKKKMTSYKTKQYVKMGHQWLRWKMEKPRKKQ